MKKFGKMEFHELFHKNYPFIKIFTIYMRNEKDGLYKLQLLKKITIWSFKRYFKINFSLASNEYKKGTISRNFFNPPYKDRLKNPGNVN